MWCALPIHGLSGQIDPLAQDLGWAPSEGLDTFLMDMIFGVDEAPGAASPSR